MSLPEKRIREIAGSAAFARGAAYAREGHVLDFSLSEEGETWSIRGKVEGSAPEPYIAVINARATRMGQRVVTQCTCPVGEGCKHVAAVLIAARGGKSEGSNSWRTSWQRSLASLKYAHASQHAPTPVAVEFSVAESGNTYDVVLRLCKKGKSGKWVRSGISWGDYLYAGYERTRQGQLLHELAALFNGRQGYYSSLRSKVSLSSVESSGVWPLLHRARLEGVPFFLNGADPTDETAVRISLEEASMSVDVAAGYSESWLLSPRIVCEGQQFPSAVAVPLGSPAHGVAVWEAEENTLFLAPLPDPGQQSVLEVFARNPRIEIPRSEQETFLEEYYHVMSKHAPCISTDNSVQLPQYSPPLLCLTVTHKPHKLELKWAWIYALGSVEREILPVDTEDAARDREAERAILTRAREVFAQLPEVFDERAETYQLERFTDVPFTDASAAIAAQEAIEELRELPGVRVDEYGDKRSLRRAEEDLSVSLREENHTSDWFDLAVEVSVGDEIVPFSELFTAVATGEHYMVLASGVYFPLDVPELQQLRDLIEESRALTESPEGVVRLSRFHASYFEELSALGVLSEQARAWGRSVKLLASAEKLPEPPSPPASFAATLRPYQQAGYAWLMFLYSNQLGGVLADDMGLGKTLQTLAVIARARADDPEGPPFLVIAPTSVVGNWAAEIRKFAPHLRVATISETEKKRRCTLNDAIADADVVVTSYTLFRLEEEQYAEQKFSAAILDEAQWVKNYQSKSYKGIRQLTAPVTIALTGTPMENNLSELWSVLSLAAPGLFPHPRKFTEYYGTPIEKKNDRERLRQLRRRVQPFLLRRTKEEVAADLPEKIENTLELELLPKHRRAYQTHLQRERQKILGLLDDVQKNRFEIFRSLTLLRQAALDLSLVDNSYTGWPSTKLDVFEELVTEITAEGHRVLVFSQFTRFLERIAARCDTAGLSYCYLDGSTRNRQRVVQEFKEGDASVFLISLKAGGVGLNLTEADYCIVMDPWWNPATENQAIDRAHRIGQTRNVMVYRMVAKDTIEEKVTALSQKKAALFESVLSETSEANIGQLTSEEIRSLVE